MSDRAINTAFIVAEYNPFHNGHKYHIEKTRENGITHIVAIMSPNFVQRGDIAVCDKHLRAQAALLGGVDLVLELPLKYAVSNASYFAKGAISVIEKTQLQGDLSFGAKSSLEDLLKLAEICEDEKTQQEVSELSRIKGLSYPAAQSLYIKDNYSEQLSFALDDANSILGLEYIKAAKNKNMNLNFMIIERVGAKHDSHKTNGSIASAMHLRDEIYKEYNSKKELYDLYNIKNFLPKEALEIYNAAIKNGEMPSQQDKFELAALSRLYNLTAEDFAKINNVNHGLENKIEKALNENCTLNGVYNDIKSKRYTHARVRQIILNSALGITKDFLNEDIPYVRILGHNEKGRELLRIIKERASTPFISNLSEIDTTDRLSERTLKLDVNAGRLYELCKPISKKSKQRFY